MPTQVENGYNKPRIQFTADGQQKEFQFFFNIYEPENAQIYINDVLQTSGYTLSLPKDSDGGIVIFDTAPENGNLITIYRHLDLKRTTDFKEGGPFRSSVVNTEFDYQLACMEQLEDSIGRTVTFPQYAPMNLNINLPMPDAGKSIIWNESEDSLVNSSYKVDDAVDQSRFYCEQTNQKLSEVKSIAATVSGQATDVANMRSETSNYRDTAEECAASALASANRAAINAVNSLYNQNEICDDFTIRLKDGVTIYTTPLIEEPATIHFDFSQLTYPANMVTFEVYLSFSEFTTIEFEGAEFIWLNQKAPNLEANNTMTKILTFRNTSPGNLEQWIVSMEGGF